MKLKNLNIISAVLFVLLWIPFVICASWLWHEPGYKLAFWLMLNAFAIVINFCVLYVTGLMLPPENTEK
jgi:hypothetical protein